MSDEAIEAMDQWGDALDDKLAEQGQAGYSPAIPV